MDFTINKFDNLHITPRYGNYNCKLSLEGVDAGEMVESMSRDSIQELAKHVSYVDVIEYHGIEEILGHIGENKIREYLEEYHPQ